MQSEEEEEKKTNNVAPVIVAAVQKEQVAENENNNSNTSTNEVEAEVEDLMEFNVIIGRINVLTSLVELEKLFGTNVNIFRERFGDNVEPQKVKLTKLGTGGWGVAYKLKYNEKVYAMKILKGLSGNSEL